MKIGKINSQIDRYTYEMELYNNILAGDKEKVKEKKEDIKAFIEEYSSRNNKKVFNSAKGVAISLLSVVSRMSISKGKSVAKSFEIADPIFIKMINAKTLEEIGELAFETIDKYTDFNYERTDLFSLPIRKTIDYINTHLKEKISLNDLSLVSNLSNDYLSFKFKNEVGININTYIVDKKLEQAHYDISFNGYDRNLYKKYAFSTQSYFISCFKKKYKTSPKEFYSKNILKVRANKDKEI